MKITEYINPYDFANPITELNLFAGRDSQLNEIDYYLKHGKNSKKPINLSLIGDRAAGKTSLLNMIEIKAIEKDFLTVKIDLNEGDVISEMHFFFKIFDSIINAAFAAGFYGGFEGVIFNEYLNQTSSYLISDDISFKPFLFPIQYAKAMDRGNINIIISEMNYKRDLENVKNEINKSIILLFDECNVLSTSRILLEKVRNIFMNKTNYMLVFTGTKDLFPIIDDIFSPIIRQFKKINVDEFKELRETEMCVNKPLLDIGLDPNDIFNHQTYSDLHNISEGKPYEIQLICHNMFKKMQQGKETEMVLNHSVMEDVRQELEMSQDLANRPKLYDIKSLDKSELDNLNYLCKSLGKAPHNEILNFEYAIYGNTRVERKELQKSYDKFIDKGILYIDKATDYLYFFGDDFDKLYTKYYALERGVQFEFNTLPFFLNIYFSITNVLKIKDKFFDWSSHNNVSSEKAQNYLLGAEKPEFDLSATRRVYRVLHGAAGGETHRIKLTLMVNDTELFINFYTNEKSELKEYKGYLKSLKKRIPNSKGFLFFVDSNITKIKVPIRETIENRIIDLGSKELIGSLVRFHENNMYNEHFEGSTNLAVEHCESIYNLDVSKDKYYCINEAYNVQNIGYIFLINDKLEKAKECLDSLSESSNFLNKALCQYNYGILNLKLDRKAECLKNMNDCIVYAKKFNPASDVTIVTCLIIPYKIDTKSEIGYMESKEELDLIKSANNIIALLK